MDDEEKQILGSPLSPWLPQFLVLLGELEPHLQWVPRTSDSGEEDFMTRDGKTGTGMISLGDQEVYENWVKGSREYVLAGYKYINI